MAFGVNIGKIQEAAQRRIKAQQEAEAQKKSQQEAAAQAQKKSEYQNELNSTGSGTVADRVKKQAGMAGMDDSRTQDIIKGANFGQAVLGEEGLGRLGESDELSAMQKQAAELAKGYSSEEQMARQEKGIESIQDATSSQQRAAQASLARSGVKGMAAGTQLANIAQSGIQARGNLERDLIIGNRDAQMQGLQAQSGLFNQAQARQQFDISQAAKEKDIQLQAGLGFAQMGATERAAEANRQAQVQAAAASKQKSCFVQGTKIIMQDGSLKNIEDIKIADKIKDGGIVYGLQQSITDGYYVYNNTMVTGSHIVFEDGIWVRVKDSVGGAYVQAIEPVYNLSCENHIIVTADMTTFSDFDEVDDTDSKTETQRLEELNGETSELLQRGRGV